MPSALVVRMLENSPRHDSTMNRSPVWPFISPIQIPVDFVPYKVSVPLNQRHMLKPFLAQIMNNGKPQ